MSARRRTKKKAACQEKYKSHVGAAKIIKKAAAPGAGLARIILLARPAADGRLLLELLINRHTDMTLFLPMAGCFYSFKLTAATTRR